MQDDEDVVRLTHIKKLLEAVEKTSINDRREFLEVLGEMFQKGVKDLSAFREEIKQHDMPFLAPLFDLDDEYAKKTLAIFDILIDLFKSVEAEDESKANDLVVVPEKKRRKLCFGDFQARNEEAGKNYKRRVLESNTSHGFPFVPVSRFFVKQHSTSGFHHRLGQFRGALNGNPRGNGFIGNSKTSPGELRRRLNSKFVGTLSRTRPVNILYPNNSI